MPWGDRAKVRNWAFDEFGVRAVYLVTLVLACLAPAQSDTYWLLRAGRDFWHTGHIAETDTYTYTASGANWPNHEWLWEALAYPAHLAGGMPLLSLVNALLLTAALVITMNISEKRGPMRIAVALLAPVLIAPSAAPRPQVASALLFVVTIHLLARERYWLLVPLFWFWANLHGAVAGGGLLLVGCTLAVTGHALVTRAPTAVSRARRLGATTTASGLVTLANPMGIGLWTYVLTSHSRSKANGIAEWTSPLQASGSTVAAFWIILGFTIAVVMLRWRRITGWRTAVPLIAAVVTLPTAVDAIRNVTPFMLAVAPLLVALLGQAPDAPQNRVSRPLLPLGVGAMIGAVTFSLVWIARPPMQDWDPLTPAAAAQIEACPGAVYTDYLTGGYVEWYAPSVKTFVDNRQDPFPRSVVKTSSNLETNGRYASLFARYDVSCAVVTPRTKLTRSLTRGGWHSTFRSKQAEIFMHD